MMLIAGIDPGTTVGYALLDLKGNVIMVGSKREFSNEELVMLLHDKGTVLIMGTDKHKVPGFVQEAATKLGAKTVYPDLDLRSAEKRVDFDVADDHQRDALASAIFAYKNYSQLLHKILNAFPEHFEELAFLVIRHGLSIKAAISMLEEKPAQERFEEYIERKLTPEAIARFYNQRAELKERIMAIESKNSELTVELSALKKRNAELKKNITDIVSRKAKNTTETKERMINALQHQIRQLKTQLLSTKKESEEFERLLFEDKIVMRKIQDLNKAIATKQGEILFVEDPRLYNEKVTSLMRNNVGIIISRVQLTRNEEARLPFIVLNVDVKDIGKYVIADKEKIDKALSSKHLVKNIVEEYKKSRVI